MSEQTVNVSMDVDTENEEQQATPVDTEATEDKEETTAEATEDTSKDDTQEEQKEEPEDSEQVKAEQEATDNIAKGREVEKQLTESLAEHNIDFDALADKYVKTGSLSKADYEALDKAGYPKNVVDAYIAGVEAQNQQAANTVINGIGGQEEYNKLVTYIQSKGDKAVDAYNELVDKGNISTIVMFLNGVKAEMTLNKGTANRTVLGRQASPSPKGFKNQEEMMKAMADPRYDYDEDFRNSVDKKLKTTSFFVYNH